jgi:hypothetical protein
MTDIVCCERCGRADATLRLVVFVYVWSAGLFTSRKGAAGLWCASCRKHEGWKYSLITLVAGWWGFPWGPIYTLGALGRNALGGERPRDANAELLEVVGRQLLSGGEADEAALAFEESLALEDNPSVRRALDVAHERRHPIPAGEITVSSFRPGDVVTSGREELSLHAAPAGPVVSVGVPQATQAVIVRAAGGWAELRIPGVASGWAPEESLRRVEQYEDAMSQRGSATL